MNNCKFLLACVLLVSCSVNKYDSLDRDFKFKHITKSSFVGTPSFYLNDKDGMSGFFDEKNYPGSIWISNPENQFCIHWEYLGTWNNFDIVYSWENGGGSGVFTSINLRSTDGDRKKSRTIFGGDRSDDGVSYAIFDGVSKIYFKSHMSIETIAKQCHLSENITDYLRSSGDFSTCMACGWHDVTYVYDLNEDKLKILSIAIQPDEAPIGFKNILKKLFPQNDSSVLTGTNVRVFFQKLKKELEKTFH